MKKLTVPPFLKVGDKVIIVSPSGRIDRHTLSQTQKIFNHWGLRATLSKHAAAMAGSFAGTASMRYEDFQAAMDDDEARAIFCSRGGYGVVHFLDRLDFTRFRRHPKWLVGFSDISALHALFQHQGFASLHAPMGKHLITEPVDDPCTVYLRHILFGELPIYDISSHKLNIKGEAAGILRGGNMTVLNGLRATPFDLPLAGTILFLEDIGERPHTIERMFYNLKLSGDLSKLTGLIIGQFTEYNPTDSLLRQTLYESIADMVRGYGYPVCFDFPVGHVTNNLPLICGAEVNLIVEKHVTLQHLIEKK
ncbi:MAG: LD-carboxypeptidase [Prevotellaceae bacterium]|jgi:muramoyltetrapeptide carboxypeptidase|nr:LD-carboxypeptidase [Prevotellaceae bacterium]